MNETERSSARTEPASRGDALRSRALVFLAFVVGLAALRASYPVTMPLAVALIVIAAVWPVKPWLDGKVPSWLSYLLTVLILVLALILFSAAIYFSLAEIVRALLVNWPRVEQSYSEIVAWVRSQGIPLGYSDPRRRFAMVQALLADAYSFIMYLGFIGVLVILGLPEVPRAYRKLRSELSAPARQEFLATAETIADKVRKYIGVTFLTSCITGIASAAWAYALGLELALTWGLLNFLLNFIPVIGNIIGIIPPTLYAVAQWDDWSMTLLVFAGFAVIQLAISNFVYPLMQGKSLSLSPIVIVIALAFWSWMWGIAGALIAVPMTAATAIICEHFDRSRWISRLLSRT